MKYTYAYKTSDGVRHEDEITANSREEVFEALRSRGIKAIKVVAADGSKANGEPSVQGRKRMALVALLLGLAIGAVVVNLWLKVVIARPRPYADPQSMFYPIWLDHGSHTESDFSFPSGHTNAAFAAMIPVFWLGNKRWSWLALVFGVLMGISRIHLMVHYPSDVLCGAITGTLAGIIGTLIALRIPDSSMWYGWDLRKQRRKGAHE